MSTPQKTIITEFRCELSRHFPVTQTNIELIRYQLKLLPSIYGGNQEVILSFEDDMEKVPSNPQCEGEMILSFLSLLFNCRVHKTGYRVNGLDLSKDQPSRTQMTDLFEGQILNTSPENMTSHIFTLGDQLTKQFMRACNAYSLAIVASELDCSLSFLLLVTALECLSTQEQFCPNDDLDKSKNGADRYCRFVKEYCRDIESFHPKDGDKGFLRDLKTIYYSHRSGFVHAGKEVSDAARAADEHGFNNIGHFIDGKQVFTPGLVWFFQIVRNTLLGFLENFPRANMTANHDVLADIARSRAFLNMKFE